MLLQGTRHNPTYWLPWLPCAGMPLWGEHSDVGAGGKKGPLVPGTQLHTALKPCMPVLWGGSGWQTELLVGVQVFLEGVALIFLRIQEETPPPWLPGASHSCLPTWGCPWLPSCPRVPTATLTLWGPHCHPLMSSPQPPSHLGVPMATLPPQCPLCHPVGGPHS